MMNIYFTAFKNKLFSEITETPPVLKQKYLPSLDGLRAISIMIVILSHIINVRLNIKNTIIDGALGVQIFFVISGFLITSLLIKEKIKTSRISLSKFYIRRALRIFPIAYLFILIVFLFDKYYILNISGSDYFSAIFYYKNFVSKAWQLNHYWSLSVEEQFYLIFPFILHNVKLKNYILICLSLLIFSPVINALAFHDYFYQQFFMTLSKLFAYNSIVFGSLFSILLFKFDFSFLKNRMFNNFLIFFLVCISYLIHPLFLSEILRLTLISFLIIKNITYNTNWFYTFLNFRFIRYIGFLSYSLYVWQQIFTEAIPWAKSFKYGDSIFLNFVLLFIVAYLSYNYFEKPFLKLKEKFEDKEIVTQPK